MPLDQTAEDHKNEILSRGHYVGDILLDWFKSLSGAAHKFERFYRNKIAKLMSNDRRSVFLKELDDLRSETLFLEGRNRLVDETESRIEAIDYILNDFKIDNIISASENSKSKELFDKVSLLETIYHNQHITGSYRPGNDLSDQSGLARISLIKFLIIKCEMCYSRGIKLTEKTIGDFLLKDTEIRLMYLRNEMRQLFEEACAIGANDPKSFKEFREYLDAELKFDPEIPEEAPELYKERKEKKESPFDFLERVYGQWLHGNGLFRPHIKALDKSLYQAMYKRGFPEGFEEVLPAAQGSSIENLGRSVDDLLEAKRSSRRLANNRRRESKRELPC